MSDKLEALKAVERFDAEIEIHGGESFAVWSPAPSGSHVSAKDYDALLAALEEARTGCIEVPSTVIGARERDELRRRAEAAEQREGHLKADAAVMGKRIAELEVTQMTGPLSLVLKRAAELERIIEGVDQLAIDGGWTARKMSEYAKSLETRNAELEQRLQQPIKLPNRDATIKTVYAMCQLIPGSTTWNAAEWMYDEIAAGFKVEGE